LNSNSCSKIHPYSDRKAYPISFFPPLSAEFDVSIEGADRFVEGIYTTHSPNPENLIYIHIPFCRSVCHFCGFYRKSISEFRYLKETELWRRFVDNLIREIRLWARSPAMNTMTFSALYIGGGSPSLMPPDEIKRLLHTVKNELPVDSNLEISFESEPISLGDESRVSVLREMGVSRVSFGVQTFDPECRKLCNLQPTMQEIQTACDVLKRYGYPVSLDLMYDLPGQTTELFLRDLQIAIHDLGAVHVDLYDNIPYPNTEFFKNRTYFEPLMPDMETSLALIYAAMDFFQAHGFIQITSDDFVLPGHEYKMKFLTYGFGSGKSGILAMGPSAVGYLDTASYRNQVVEHYLDRPFEHSPIQRLRLSTPEEEMIRPFVFFPKLLKLDLNLIDKTPPQFCLDTLADQVHKGLAQTTRSGFYELTRLGRVWAEQMMFDYLKPAEKRRLYKIVQ
jgi:anaerobilin synthase